MRKCIKFRTLGHRLEIFGEPNADKVTAISDNFNIEAKTIGWTEQSLKMKNQLEIRSKTKDTRVRIKHGFE